jgi:hypothetical protein
LRRNTCTADINSSSGFKLQTTSLILKTIVYKIY